MENLNLAGDEPVVYKSQKIISSGTGYEAILTDRRFILTEHGTGTIREEFSLGSLVLAVPGFNTLREPVILLTVSVPDGNTRQLELIFVHTAADLNIQDRDKCLAALKTRNVAVGGVPHQAAPPSLMQRGRTEADTESEVVTTRPAVPEWTVFGTPRYTLPKAQDAAAPARSPLFLIIAVLLIIGICIGGVLIAGQVMGSKPAPATVVVPGTETPVPESVVPTPALVPETTAVPYQDTTSVAGAVPANGIWIRVSYPGNFSGSVGAQGWMTEVNGSGTRLYVLPVHDTLLEGSVSKQDGSGNTLDLGVYNGGVLVSGFSTAKPWGTIDINMPVGPALMNSPVTSTVAPTIALPPTPDTSLVLHSVPLTGVWVRVAYPGNFTGSITTNGLARDVNNSGDQFFQFPMTSGTIDGFIAKGDGSVKNLIVQVYKDGAMVTYGNTSAPLGTVEIHTTV
jgi:hypothetical protein